jgi:hypothetical protein
MELAFGPLMHLIQSAGFDYSGFNLVTTAIFFIGWTKFCRSHPNPLEALAFSFPVLIIHMAMSAVRQAVALSFIMLALSAFADRKRVAYFLYVCLAATFHYSAVIFIPLGFVIGKRPRISSIIVYCAAGLVSISFFAPSSVEVYQTRYVGAGATQTNEALGGVVRVSTVTAAGLMFLLLLGRRWQAFFPKDYDLYRILSVATLPLIPITMFSSVIGDRVGYYLVPTQLGIFARARYLAATPGMGRLLSASAYFILLCFLAVWVTFSPIASQCYLPYDNYLFGESSAKRY